MNTQKEKWNQFIVANRGSFLQSFEWGEFQESLGRKIWRIEIGEQLKALVIKHNLLLGKSYLYCPRGPVLVMAGSDSDEAIPNEYHGIASLPSVARNDIILSFLKKIQNIAKKEKAIFFKIEPDKDRPLTDGQWPSVRGRSLIQSVKQIQPQKTLILDISKSEEELLSQMGQKTRYNIKLAERKGVEASLAGSEKIETFWRLASQTVKRDRFHLHPKIYYQKMLEILDEAGLVKLFIAKYKNQIIGANIVCFFNETATYLHGASDYDFRRLMAPYLLQRQAILEAKRLGFKFYDFWGLDEKKWPGVTRFKRGFGGHEIVYPGAFDLVFEPGWYKIYNLVRKIL